MKDHAILKEEAKSYFELLAFPAEAQEYLLAALSKLYQNAEAFAEFAELLASYDESIDVDIRAMTASMQTVSEKAGIHVLTGYMLMYVCMLPRLRRYYEEKGIPDEIFVRTLCDLRYKVVEGKLVEGVYGISEGAACGWYPSMFACKTLAFARLQFVFGKAGFECEVDGVKVTADTPVLHIHIPRTGTKIDRESILASYREAAEYYASAFGDRPIIMTCSSWMLFPRHAEFLAPDSNMMQFYHDFHLVSSGYYDNYASVWRLFDCHYTGDVDALPANTSLRRAYVDLIRRGEKTGWGRGVIIYKK